jgi:hypothetical protein
MIRFFVYQLFVVPRTTLARNLVGPMGSSAVLDVLGCPHSIYIEKSIAA